MGSSVVTAAALGLCHDFSRGNVIESVGTRLAERQSID